MCSASAIIKGLCSQFWFDCSRGFREGRFTGQWLRMLFGDISLDCIYIFEYLKEMNIFGKMQFFWWLFKSFFDLKEINIFGKMQFFDDLESFFDLATLVLPLFYSYYQFYVIYLSVYCLLVRCVWTWYNHHGWLSVRKQIHLSSPNSRKMTLFCSAVNSISQQINLFKCQSSVCECVCV